VHAEKGKDSTYKTDFKISYKRSGGKERRWNKKKKEEMYTKEKKKKQIRKDSEIKGG